MNNEIIILCYLEISSKLYSLTLFIYVFSGTSSNVWWYLQSISPNNNNNNNNNNIYVNNCKKKNPLLNIWNCIK